MKKIIFLIFILFCAENLWTAEIEITAEADRTVIAPGESFDITVTVSGSTTNLPDIESPNISNVKIINHSSSTQYSFVNGKMSMNKEEVFTILPDKDSGTLRILPFKVKYKGTYYQTNTITVKIDPNAQRTSKQKSPSRNIFNSNSSDDDVLVFSNVNKTKAYIGEQVIYTFSLYYSVRLIGTPEFHPPKFEHFWFVELPESKNSIKRYKGKQYYVYEKKYALFPTKTGKINIDRATLTYSSIGSVFGARSRTKRLYTKSAELDIMDLPSPPAGSVFTGFVGELKLYDKFLTSDFTAGNPITYEVKLSGTGNIESLKIPDLKDTDDFEVHPPEVSTNVQKKPNGIQGIKDFKFLLIPQVDGKLTIPELKFVYFSPKNGSYKYVQNTRSVIQVKKGKQSNNNSSSSRSNKSQIDVLNLDIRFIQTNLPLILSYSVNPFKKNLNWFLIFAALIYPIAALFMKIYKDKYGKNSPEYFMNNAKKIALNEFNKIEKKTARKDSGIYENLTRILIDYIDNKFQIHAKILTNEEIIKKLRDEKNIDEKQIETLETLFTELDLVKFTKNKTNNEESYSLIREKFLDFLHNT